MKKRIFVQFIPLEYGGRLDTREKEDYLLLPSEVAAEIGMDSYIVTYSHFYFVKPEGKNGKNTLAKKGIKYIRCRSILDFIITLIKLKPDFIYANSRAFLSFLCPLFSRKSLLISHDCEPPSTGFGRFIFRIIGKWFSYHRANTPYEIETLLRLGIKKEKIKLIPLAIDVDFYSEKIKKSKKELLKKFKLPEGKRYLTFLANARSHKTPIIAIKALKELPKDIILLIIGIDMLPRERLKSISELAKMHGMSERVIELGLRTPEEVRELFHITDVYVHPTFREGQCLAVYEAASAGLPLCLSNIGSFKSVFNGSALFHSKMDDKRLANNILKYLSDKRLAKAHAERNRKILKRVSYNVVKNELKKVFLVD